MPTLAKIIKTLLKICLSLLGILLFAVLALFDNADRIFPCGNQILQDAISPDGKWIATAFERNCGAGSPFYRVVSLRPARRGFNSSATDNWVFRIRNRPKIELTWTAADRLSIYSGYQGYDPVKFSEWKTVKISYPF
jgi:hypothetical protein